LLAFVYGIIESSTYGWWKAKEAFTLFGEALPWNLSPTPIALIFGIALLILFAGWQQNIEKRGRTPLVSLRIFRNHQFTSGASVIALLTLGMVGLIFAIPVFLQSVRNLDAFHTGLALLPMSAIMLVVAPGSAVLSKYVSAKRLIQVGLLVAVAASVVLHFSITASAGPTAFIPGLILFGIGMGFVMAQGSNLTLSAVSVDQAGEASGINNTLRQVGSSFGSAIIGAVLLSTLSASLATGIKDSPVIPAEAKTVIAQNLASRASEIELGGIDGQRTENISPAVKQELKKIADEASAKAARTAILYTGGFIALGFLVSFTLPNVRDLEQNENLAAKPAGSH